MPRVKRYLSIILCVVAGTVTLVYALQSAPVGVEVCRVTEGPLTVTIDEDGKTRVRERYVVSAPISGVLSRIDLQPGDIVQANGTVLATIEPTKPALLDARLLAEAESRVKAAEASKDQALARLDAAREAHGLAEHELSRAQQLIQTAAVSQAELDTAEHHERIAWANLRAAEFGDRVAAFDLELARAAFVRTRPLSTDKLSSDRLEIRSPVSGRILRVIQKSAAVVVPGQQLIEIGNTEELEIEIDVLSSDAAKISPGAKIFLDQWGGAEPLLAHVRLVEPSGFTKLSALGVEEQRVNVIADFDPSTEKLKGLGDGYRVDARIVVWEAAKVMKIPTGALFRDGRDWAVFTVKQGRAELRRITVGQMNGQAAEVLDGLSLGEELIEFPSDKIRSGVRIVKRFGD